MEKDTTIPTSKKYPSRLVLVLAILAVSAWITLAGERARSRGITAAPANATAPVTVEASVKPVVFFSGESALMNLCVTNTNALSDPEKGFLPDDEFLFTLPGCGTFNEATPGNCVADISVDSSAPDPILPDDFECQVTSGEVVLTYAGQPKPFLCEDRFCITVSIATPSTASCVLEYRFKARDEGLDEDEDEDSDLGEARISQPQIPSFFSLDVIDRATKLDAWLLTGNALTDPAMNFLGTTDNVPFEIRVNNSRAMRIEPQTLAPNLIGGSASNSAASGTHSVVVGGGRNNTVFVHGGVIGGGVDNVAGPEGSDPATKDYPTVGGGVGNTASGRRATVGGGTGNSATGGDAVVAGGNGNTSSGEAAGIPGGGGNVASGDWSFAAGCRAGANHQGAFVWADCTQFGMFESTGPHQFLIRAQGGVAINTTSPEPGYAITVQGSGYARAGSWIDGSSGREKTNIETLRDALEKVSTLRGVSYNWKEDGRRDIGLVAEEVAEVVPEVVRYEATGKDAIGIDYDHLVGLLIEALKEQERKLASQEAFNKTLLERVAALEQELKAVRQSLP